MRRRDYLTKTGVIGIGALLAGCSDDGGDAGGGGGDGGGGDGGGGDGGDDTPTEAEDDTETPTEASQDFPDQPVTVVVPFGAGGGTDSQYRPFDEYWTEELGVSTNIENRSGASGRLGWNHLYNQEGDGYTVGVISVATAVLNQALYDVEYDIEEMTPIGTTSVAYFGLVAAPDKFENFDDMIEWAQNNELAVASVGSGTTGHFSLVSLLQANGIDNYREVPYDGGNEAAAAAASGDVDIAMSNVAGITSLIEDDRVDLLFINRPEQSQEYPDVPTHEDYEFDIPAVGLEIGMFGPPGIPDERVSVLEDTLISAVETDGFQEWAQNNGYQVSGQNSQELEQLVGEMQKLSSDYVELVGEQE